MSKYRWSNRLPREPRGFQRVTCTGQIQIRVLEALKDGSTLTAKEIADVSGIPYGSVAGAISGMVRMYNRHWLRRHSTNSPPYNPFGGLTDYEPPKFSITTAGQHALISGKEYFRKRVALADPTERPADYDAEALSRLFNFAFGGQFAWRDPMGGNTDFNSLRADLRRLFRANDAHVNPRPSTAESPFSTYPFEEEDLRELIRTILQMRAGRANPSVYERTRARTAVNEAVMKLVCSNHLPGSY